MTLKSNMLQSDVQDIEAWIRIVSKENSPNKIKSWYHKITNRISVPAMMFTPTDKWLAYLEVDKKYKLKELELQTEKEKESEAIKNGEPKL